MAYWMAGATIGSAALGYLGSQQTNKANQQIANTPQTQANTNQTQQSFVPNAMANPMYGYLGGIGQQMGQSPQPFFPGQGYVGPSAPTQAGVNMGMGSLPYYGQAANQALGAQPYMNQMLGAAGNNYGFLSNAADAANNPYVQGMISANERSVWDNLVNKAIPQINSGSVGVNALGSSRQGIMQGQAVGDSAKALANQNAKTLFDAYGMGLGAQTSALGQTGNMLQNMMAPAQASAYAGGMMNQGGQTGMQYGQSVEDYQLRALQDAMARYDYQYQEPWNRANNLGGILGQLQPLGVQNSSMAGTGASSGPVAAYQSPMMGALQGGMGGGLLAYSLSKDGMFGNTPATGNYAPVTGPTRAPIMGVGGMQ